MFHTSERAFGFPYRVIRTPEGSGLPGRTSGAGLAGGSDVQLREADDLGRVTQDGELADHPAGDDVEVVVAVVLAGVGDVVVTYDNDVVGGLFPQQAAGELAQAERLEVIGDDRAGVGGDVLPLHGYERRAEPIDRVQRPSPRRTTERCALIGTFHGRLWPFAYRNGRYEAAFRCQSAGGPKSSRLIRAEVDDA